MEFSAFANRHYSGGCRTLADGPGFSDLSLEQMCDIPDRLSGDASIAFRAIWRGAFPGIPIPDSSQCMCPGRWSCIGFKHIRSPRLAGLTSLWPLTTSEPRIPPLSLQRGNTPDSELWSETSPSEPEMPPIFHELGTRAPRELLNTASNLSNDSDSGIQMKLSPPKDQSSLGEEALLQRLADDVDELRRRLGDNMARRILNGFLAPDILSGMTLESGRTREPPQPLPHVGESPPVRTQPKAPVIDLESDSDSIMEDDWSPPSSPAEGFMKNMDNSELPAAPWMSWMKAGKS